MGVTRIHGRKIYYNEDSEKARRGLEHLRRDLQPEETKPLFNNARVRGESAFEDDQERQFSIVRRGDGTYELVERE